MCTSPRNSAGMTIHRERSLQQNTIMQKGKGMYINYQKKGETGKEYTQDDAVFDLEAAEATWPNFKTFFERFKDHLALGLGSVEDSAMPQSSTVTREEVVELERETDTPSGSRCPSRLSIRSVGGDSDSKEEEDEIPIPAKKAKVEETPLVARVGKKKGKQIGATQFLVAFGELQEQAQTRQ